MKVYNIYIDDKINFAADKLNMGIFDFDLMKIRTKPNHNYLF